MCVYHQSAYADNWADWADAVDRLLINFMCGGGGFKAMLKLTPRRACI